MPLNPKKSREAHSQIGLISPAAVSSPQPQDSLTRGHCDLRGSQPVVGDRGATTGQPSLTEVEWLALGAGAGLVVSGLLILSQLNGALGG